MTEEQTISPDEVKDRAVSFLDEVLERMGLDATIDADLQDDKLIINIDTETPERIIGRRGQVVDALQHLATKVAYAGVRRGESKPIVVDAGGYRAKQIERLEELAAKMKEKALESGRKVRLKPMNAHDRRIVHMALADDADVTTESEGERQDRHVCVIPNDAAE